ncbi:hypothetical protein [Actinoplanes sp. NPDC049265]|uniref:hypothetical protein n=1 Tax=Actinoplanes sp. NPDC049265 TaxID=3363902 RepID=UPI00371F2FE4
MTTQLPYPPQQPHQQQSPPAYPTAPPWASPPPAAAAEPPPAPGTPWEAPYPQTGQLLVPYPEEMRNAARPTPPAWWPVAIWTFFFGILGTISAARRADQARRGGNGTAPYWITWAATMALSAVLTAILVFVAYPAIYSGAEQKVTTEVEAKMRTDGQLKTMLGVGATAVNCDPIGSRDRTGIRTYDCALTLEDERTGTLTVTADTNANWSVVRRK